MRRRRSILSQAAAKGLTAQQMPSQPRAWLPAGVGATHAARDLLVSAAGFRQSQYDDRRVAYGRHKSARHVPEWRGLWTAQIEGFFWRAEASSFWEEDLQPHRHSCCCQHPPRAHTYFRDHRTLGNVTFCCLRIVLHIWCSSCLTPPPSFLSGYS